MIDQLPAVNAGLNFTTFVLLTAGFVAIKSGRKQLHKACMISAVVVGVIFLTSYLIYHFHAKLTYFEHQGWIRWVYFTILISHTILAIVNLPLIIITLRHALKGRLDRHKKIARWTLCFWWYVSVTGIIVYFILYQWFPSGDVA